MFLLEFLSLISVLIWNTQFRKQVGLVFRKVARVEEVHRHGEGDLGRKPPGYAHASCKNPKILIYLHTEKNYQSIQVKSAW